MMASKGIAFDPDFAGPAEWAAMYRARGLQVVPCYLPSESKAWKRPKLSEWGELRDNLLPEAAFDRWYGSQGMHAGRPNMGLIAGASSGNIVVIDLDMHKKPEAAAWWQGLLATHNFGFEPETWRQITGGGGRQIMFRARSGWKAPTNKTGIGVDIRGYGGFAVLPPSLHDSGSEYRWEKGWAPYDIEIEDAPEWLLAAIDDLVARYGGDTSGIKVERVEPEGQYNAFGKLTDGREHYMTKLVWAAVIGLRRTSSDMPDDTTLVAAMDEVFDTYLRNVASNYPGMTEDGLEREGRGKTLFVQKWRRALSKWSGQIAEAAASQRPFDSAPDIEDCGSGNETIALQPAFPIDARAIRPREWIVPGLMLRKHLSVLVAPPGSGKSLLTLQLAIAAAAGLDWGGWTVRHRARVLVINAEDDLDEMRRRLAAAVRIMGINQEDIADSIFLAEDPGSIIVAKADHKTKTVVRTPLVERLKKTIVDNRIDVLVVDPFAETFEGDENSNSEIKWAGIIWRDLARQTGASALLVHHTRKYASGMAGDADASRGGGALIGTARIMATLFAMTEDEASVMGVGPEERTRYVRFDDAKANMSLVTGVARWFEKESVTLPNGSGLIPGDEVGVLKPWRPPGLLAGVDMPTILAIVDTIDRGILDDEGQPTGGFYTRSANSVNKTRWAGTPIMRMIGCDEDRAKRILKEWLTNGVFDEFEYQDGKQARKGLKAIPANRPGRVER